MSLMAGQIFLRVTRLESSDTDGLYYDSFVIVDKASIKRDVKEPLRAIDLLKFASNDTLGKIDRTSINHTSLCWQYPILFNKQIYGEDNSTRGSVAVF